MVFFGIGGFRVIVAGGVVRLDTQSEIGLGKEVVSSALGDLSILLWIGGKSFRGSFEIFNCKFVHILPACSRIIEFETFRELVDDGYPAEALRETQVGVASEESCLSDVIGFFGLIGPLYVFSPIKTRLEKLISL